MGAGAPGDADGAGHAPRDLRRGFEDTFLTTTNEGSAARIRVGIVGCGRVAEHHLRHLQRLPGIEIAGLVDANQEAAQSLAARFGIARTFPTLEAMFAAEAIHAVHVLTPPSSHRDVAMKALEHGAHVLVEKPLALTLSDATEILDKAKAKNLLATPDFIQLFHPRMLEATALIESGALGRVVNCTCELGVDLDMRELREARGLHWSYELPGGVMHNYITHALYLVMRWTGAARSVHVTPRSHGSLPQGLTDQLDVMIDGEDASGHIVMSAVAQPSPYLVRIQCERGVVVVDFDTMSVTSTALGALPRAVGRILRNPRTAWQMTRQTVANVWGAVRKTLLPYHGLKALFEGWYSAIAAGSAPPISDALARAVSQAEHEVLRQAGKVHLDLRARASKQTGIQQRERVLVTGAAGYVGRYVVERLVAEGYQVRALVRPMSHVAALEALGVEIRFGDLRDGAAVLAAADGMQVIVHVGAAIRGSAEYMRESTVNGTKHLADAARAAGVSRVIYISSMAVYDFSAIGRGTVTAESPLETRASERGVASAVKRDAEDIALEQARSGAGWTILRPSLIFGGSRDPFSLIGPKKGRLLLCLGSPSMRLRLVHVHDVASAVILAMRTPESAGRVYTLSHPETITYREYFRKLPSEQMASVRPVYLPRWFVGTAAFGVRTLNRLRGRRGGMTRRQVTYLYADVAVDSEPIRRLGWAPSGGLGEQLAAIGTNR